MSSTRRIIGAVLLALLVVLAGCSTPEGSEQDVTEADATPDSDDTEPRGTDGTGGGASNATQNEQGAEPVNPEEGRENVTADGDTTPTGETRTGTEGTDGTRNATESDGNESGGTEPALVRVAASGSVAAIR